MAHGRPSPERTPDRRGDAAAEPSLDLAPGEVRTRATKRWYGVAGLALLALGLGLVTEGAGLLLASALGLGLAAYGRLTRPPTTDLSVERTVSDADPDAGDEVTVTVRVTNESDRPLVDARLIDGVPSGLPVVGGTPRAGAVLAPGGETTFSYAVEATPGAHRFEPCRLVARDPSGSTERVAALGEATTVTCVPPLHPDPPAVPLRSRTTPYVGRTPADDGGDGVEFHAVREYRSGDAVGRIDWKRTARTRDLTTVEYRRERAAAVAVVVDARRAAYRAPSPDATTAVERGVEAARAATASLLARGNTVGLSALSPDPPWHPPDAGSDHRARLRSTLSTHEAFSATPPAEETNVLAVARGLRGRLSADTQVLLVTPLIDDDAERAVVRFDGYGYPTTVISPDPTTTDTAGGQLAAADRAVRIARLRRRGVPVVDWGPDEPLAAALARLDGGWSA